MPVNFEGQLDTVLSGFVCIRGYASFSDLAEHSSPNPSYQRNLIEEHKNEMKNFLEKGSYIFFPEVILAYSIKTKDNKSMSQILMTKGKGTPLKIKNNKATLQLNDNEKLDRIDGNHRLSAFERNKGILNDLKVPFCIILLDDSDDDTKKKNIIFYNINFKQIPLTKEKSLELLFKKDVYSDDELKEIGLEYLITKNILQNISEKEEYKNLPMCRYKDIAGKTYMFNAINFLCKHSAILSDYEKGEEDILKKITTALKKIDSYYKEEYNEKSSSAVFSNLLYYQYEHPRMQFHKWIKNTEIYVIEDKKDSLSLDAESLKILYESIHQKEINKIFKVGLWSCCLYIFYKARDTFTKSFFKNIFNSLL